MKIPNYKCKIIAKVSQMNFEATEYLNIISLSADIKANPNADYTQHILNLISRYHIRRSSVSDNEYNKILDLFKSSMSEVFNNNKLMLDFVNSSVNLLYKKKETEIIDDLNYTSDDESKSVQSYNPNKRLREIEDGECEHPKSIRDDPKYIEIINIATKMYNLFVEKSKIVISAKAFKINKRDDAADLPHGCYVELDRMFYRVVNLQTVIEKDGVVKEFKSFTLEKIVVCDIRDKPNTNSKTTLFICTDSKPHNTCGSICYTCSRQPKATYANAFDQSNLLSSIISNNILNPNIDKEAKTVRQEPLMLFKYIDCNTVFDKRFLENCGRSRFCKRY